MRTSDHIDLFDSETQEDWFPTYKELRDEFPIYQIPGSKIFVLTRYEDVMHVLVRRLHDVNKSGWFFLLPMPFDIVGRLLERSVGDISLVFTIISLGISIYLLVLYCTDGDKKNNRFGKNIYKSKKKRKRADTK